MEIASTAVRGCLPASVTTTNRGHPLHPFFTLYHMIDYFDIAFTGDDFGAFGKLLRTTQTDGYDTESFTPATIRAGTDAPSFEAHVNRKKQQLQINGCPLMWLQGHNGLGSNDLPFLVTESTKLLFARKQRSIPSSVEQQLRERSYAVNDVHVAELHRMPHPMIRALCNNIRRFALDDLEAMPLEKGIGIRLYANSRHRQVLLYDKHNYFLDGKDKHRNRLLGQLPAKSFNRYGPIWDFARMMNEHLNKGIRIETRHKRNLKARGLDIGSAWTSTTARDLHHDVLASIPLSDLPPVAEAEALLARLGQEDRRLLALWLDRRRVADFFDAPATYFRWRKRMLADYQINVSSAPIPCTEVQWSALTAASSVLETPEWAFEGSFLHYPERVALGITASPCEEAWPPPKPKVLAVKRPSAAKQLKHRR